MSQKKKTITISEERHAILSALRETNETFDDAVGRLLESHSSKPEALPQTSASAPGTTLSEEIKDSLENLRMEGESLDDVIKTLKQVTPNGRDYPGDNDRCVADREIHYARLQMLREIQDALVFEALAIKRQEV